MAACCGLACAALLLVGGGLAEAEHRTEGDAGDAKGGAGSVME